MRSWCRNAFPLGVTYHHCGQIFGSPTGTLAISRESDNWAAIAYRLDPGASSLHAHVASKSEPDREVTAAAAQSEFPRSAFATGDEALAGPPWVDTWIMEPRVSRPTMPGYGVLPEDQGTGLLEWAWAAIRLSA